MTRKFLTNPDLNGNQLLNALLQLLGADPSSPAEGRLWYDTTNHTVKFANGTSVISLGRLDQVSAPTTDVTLNSHKITNLATPTSANDAANKSYVDSAITGLDTTPPAQAASTGNVTVSNPGTAVFDGVTLSTNDLLLLRAQTTPAENGLYVFNGSSSALTRHSSMDTWAEIPGKLIVVEQGTTYADNVFLSTADPGGTLGTTAVSISRLPITANAAGAGMVLNGSAFDVVSNNAFLVVNADNIDIGTLGVTNGGTGSTTAAGARTNLGATTKYAADVGDNSSTSITVTHSLGTKDVVVSVRQNADDVDVECDVTHATTNTVTLAFTTAPATNALRVTVVG